jgi:uncharacterized membrane protein YgcG
MAPEMAGAACDDKIDESEVAATLATLVQERKIETTVEKRLLRKPKLVMRLIAERSSLTDWQRSVVDKLFFDDRTATDTDAIRDHYDSRGLDLAAIISEPITKRLRKLPGWSAKSSVFQWKVHGVALVVALALLIANPWRGDADGVLVNWQVLSGVLSMVLAWRATRENSRAVTGLSIAFAKVIAGMLPLFCISIYGLFQVSEFRLGVPLLLTTLVWNLAAFNLILDLLRTDDTPKKIAIRKNLASARAYFVAQLRASRPCLRDEWYPYLIAFGLGRNVDQWLRQFPKSLGDDLLTSRLSRTGIASTGSAGQQESLWTGGGGAFGGAGSAGAWAVAAGAVAGGIERSSPTNSSSSSSSGGGGGGGW